jgi:phospholipid N-methyltransferase
MNEDFYPTPKKLISRMFEGVNFHEVKNVLEPSAGKGDICDYISQRFEYRGANGRNVIDVIEIDDDLQATLKGKGYNLIHGDFLTFNTNKIYDLIIANFPFSEGDRHLQRALELIEKNGGNLVCLVNAETLKNPHTNLRQALAAKLKHHGATIEYLAGEFTDAERETNVEVALIRACVERAPGVSVILDSLEKAKAVDVMETRESELIEKEFLKALIARFNVECEVGIKLIDEYFTLKPYIVSRISPEKDRYASELIELKIDGAYDTKTSYINSYLSGVRHKFWELLLNDARFTSSYTSNILRDLYQKLEALRDCDFTLFNIQQLENELGKKIGEGIEQSILKLFDELSHQYAYGDDFSKGNIHYFNGWKTNQAHKINSKVIVPINGFSAYGDKNRLEYQVQERLSDMVKVFNYLAGANDDVPALVGATIRTADASGDFSSMDFRYFETTFYKKGTCHIRFKDQRLLDKFNIYGSQRKGWLPPSYGKKLYQEMDTEEKQVVDEFQGAAKYEEVLGEPDYYLVSDDKPFLLN